MVDHPDPVASQLRPRIVGIFGPADPSAVLASLREMGVAGEPASVVTGGGGVAIPRHPARFLGLATRNRTVVAADSCLVYRADLMQALDAAGHGPTDASLPDAELILRAYLAWGDACPTKLEGEFAFVVWDGAKGRGLACVDFAAGRTLFYAHTPGITAVASSVEALRPLRWVDSSWNSAQIGEIAAGLWAGSDETCYSGVRRLMPGHTLETLVHAKPRVTAHWTLPKGDERSRASFEDAAIDLRERLVAAVGERLTAAPRAAVWLSGGWDSTAVFAAGKEWLRRNGADPDRLAAVSMRYPSGDPGYEDDLIQAVADRWSCQPRWIDVGAVPIVRDAGTGARARAEPWCHPFQHWLEALADGARRAGASIAISGNGGDQLFASPIAPLSDLLWTGRWVSLRREWVERQGRGFRPFLEFAVLPGLPRVFYQALARRPGGRRPSHYLDRPIPPWIRPTFVESAGLLDRQWDERPWAVPGRASRAEMEFFFSTAYSARIFETINHIVRDRGLDHASPLLDRRIVDLAAVRPAEERSRGLESKRLLRHAMKGLLPDQVLSPRPHKTGLTVGYFERGFRGVLPDLLDQLGADMLLGDLGIVDVSEFHTHAREYWDTGRGQATVAIFQTIHTELWLRANR